ncbi:uncharacterized protein LOC118199139, partial [Stegodyphus dumicola]|uniref:uncharacterized protein LOC118199139 n=1 Tax=Stegodyphus dumicola TaxID=202533 RepID=UPI0015B2CB73
MEVRSVFVTGANRGIGLEFVRQLVALPKAPRYVFATYRNKDSLQALIDIKDSSKYSEVIFIRMGNNFTDVSKPEEVKVARAILEDTVGNDGLNLLINSAGICQVQAFPNVSIENLLQHFNTNTVGPVMGIFGPAVECPLVNIPLSITVGESASVTHKEILCAVAESLAEDVLLPPEVFTIFGGRLHDTGEVVENLHEETTNIPE